MAPVTITSDAVGFSMDTEPVIAANWNDVTEIGVFKRDLMTTDLICLVFRLNDGASIEIDEEMVGYSQFLELVTTQFDLNPSWWSDVAFPAFKTNAVTIWPPFS